MVIWKMVAVVSALGVATARQQTRNWTSLSFVWQLTVKQDGHAVLQGMASAQDFLTVIASYPVDFCHSSFVFGLLSVVFFCLVTVVVLVANLLHLKQLLLVSLLQWFAFPLHSEIYPLEHLGNQMIPFSSLLQGLEMVDEERKMVIAVVCLLG